VDGVSFQVKRRTLASWANRAAARVSGFFIMRLLPNRTERFGGKHSFRRPGSRARDGDELHRHSWGRIGMVFQERLARYRSHDRPALVENAAAPQTLTKNAARLEALSLWTGRNPLPEIRIKEYPINSPGDASARRPSPCTVVQSLSADRRRTTTALDVTIQAQFRVDASLQPI